LTERSIFDQDFETYSHELHLQRIVEALGPFPLEFLRECKDRAKYFDENGEHALLAAAISADVFARQASSDDK
jgi:serine/threonine-protein kinase SRPK3